MEILLISIRVISELIFKILSGFGFFFFLELLATYFNVLSKIDRSYFVFWNNKFGIITRVISLIMFFSFVLIWVYRLGR